MTYNCNMRRAAVAVGAHDPSPGQQKVNKPAWMCAAVSILVAILALGIAIHGAVTSGEYRSILSHQSLTPFITITFAVIGALIVSRHPRNPIGWIFTAVGLLYALLALMAALIVYGPTSAPFHRWAVWFGFWLWIPASFLPAMFVPLVFPGGQLPSPRWRFVAWAAALGLATTVLVVMLHPGPLPSWGLEENPFGIPGAAPILDKLLTLGSALLFTGLAGSLAGFASRFRRSKGIEREQMKWLFYAVGIMALGFVVGSAAWSFWPGEQWAVEISIMVSDLSILAIAVAATVAILRHHLYDINLIINRTLVYGALTTGVVMLYIGIVGGLGAFFQTGNNLLFSLLATGLAAVLFQPLRERLQRAANRLMYGERDDPYAVLSQLGRRLEASLSPEATLPAVVETVAQTLKLPYVAIALKQDGDYKIAASFGSAEDQATQLPLIYQGETTGRLILAARSPNEPFKPAEECLIEDIAHHIGVAAQAVRLNRDLEQLAADLQGSRERLVTAREEERRRLRRDLHDGLGPVLASQGLKLGLLDQLVERDPEVAKTLIDELIDQNQGVLTEIRRLVYDLRPPALDELGLVDAIRDQVFLLHEKPGIDAYLQIQIEEPSGKLPSLPAAVEVAAYRIALEAITNVSRHAQAKACTARFWIDEAGSSKTLCLEVCDDGRGFPEQYRAGVGLTSMKERAEEVGGECVVEAHAKGGTRVSARFPLFQ